MLLHTDICEFGWKAPEFTLKTPDGTSHSSREHQTDRGLLVMFICNHCPYVKAIADRLATDMDDLMDAGIGVLAVMSNDYRDYQADSPPNMAKFAAQHRFNFPYLIDEDQSVGRAFNALCTPDFFGFNGKGELQYRGRLDDAGQGDAAGRTRELVDAMLAIAETGQGPRQQTPSMGCSIKWT